MTGMLLNVLTVAVGAMIGLLVGNRLPEKIQQSVVTGLGLVTLYVGISNAGTTGNIIIPLLSIAIGVIIGELLDVHGRLEGFGGWLQQLTMGKASSESTPDTRARFITGFVTASLVFCVGPLTFVGSIQEGMGLPSGFQQIAIKSTLDFFAAMAFATSFGSGVLFSVLTILVVQGGLALLGGLLGNFMSEAMINEMTASGGLMLIGLALILLDVKRPRMANFLPALVLAPLMVALAVALGINLYPP
jgi:uncharacterized membrane protein YqgA involved in biofilm formation